MVEEKLTFLEYTRSKTKSRTYCLYVPNNISVSSLECWYYECVCFQKHTEKICYTYEKLILISVSQYKAHEQVFSAFIMATSFALLE